jgi:hypothetical protein
MGYYSANAQLYTLVSRPQDSPAKQQDKILDFLRRDRHLWVSLSSRGLSVCRFLRFNGLKGSESLGIWGRGTAINLVITV